MNLIAFHELRTACMHIPTSLFIRYASRALTHTYVSGNADCTPARGSACFEYQAVDLEHALVGPPSGIAAARRQRAYVRRLAVPPAAMSLPHSSYDPRRVCLNPFPNVSLGKHRRTIGVYLSGALVRYRVATMASRH